MADLTRLAELVSRSVQPLDGSASDYNDLIESIGGARFVLLGEASHGTHEFYRERAHITQRLIREKGFTAVAVEADWPDAYRVNRYVRGVGESLSAVDALSGFQRFPTWMWRNTDVVHFISWLREHNENLSEDERIGFYGLDLYSLNRSIATVIEYLRNRDPEAAQRAVERYGCFDRYGADTQNYGYLAGLGMDASCEQDVIDQLKELIHQAPRYQSRDNHLAREDYFNAEQNALVVQNAEAYYRSMFAGRVESWNLRDTHMAATAERLAQQLEFMGQDAKIVIWAHNSHIGDARATELGAMGELNLGQLIRERYPRETFLVGFTTHTGTVSAASGWDDHVERKKVRPSLAGSVENVFHQTGVPHFLLLLKELPALAKYLDEPLLERAIGVIYLPKSERQSHYFQARLGSQFDAVIHFDESHAVEPLEVSALWHKGETPETYPFTV